MTRTFSLRPRAARSPLILRRQTYAPGFVTVTPRSTHLVVVKLTRTWLDTRIADRHQQHETRVGTFAILPDGADCSSMIDKGEAQALIASIDADAVSSFLDGLARRFEPRAVLAGEDRTLVDLLLRLEKIDARDHTFRDQAAHDAIAHVATRYATNALAGDEASLAPSALRAVREFIFDNLASELNIARLAEIARLSPFHFSRAFARATGVPPHRYIMQSRADQAAAAIRSRRQSLADIACAHGFTDQSHMCRWMRRRYGTTATGLRAAQTLKLDLPAAMSA